ncbi:MAG: methyltransferase domain-containing protein [Candidatus Lokiarchaeota archaeon]|nr:methyltransferase domain-containing protein [Candidatus Lokiarchaeota archaeon]
MSKDIEDLKKYFNFDRYAEIYDKTREVSESFQYIIDLIIRKANFKSKKIRPRILEIGAGTGAVINFLSKSRKIVPKYIGIDISNKMLDLIKNKYARDKLDLIMADAYHLPFKKNKFNLVLMVRSIHLLSQWKKAIKESKNALKNNDLLIIITGGQELKILNDCYSNKKYIELREKYGYPIFYYGADWQYIPDYIEMELNGNLEVFKGTYKTKKKVKDIIHEFKNQLMTWHTQVPKEIHDKIVEELKHCLQNKYQKIEENEEQLGYFTIGFINFKN